MKAQDIVKKERKQILRPTKINSNQEYPHWNEILVDYPGSPVVKTPHFQCRFGMGSMPGQGTKIPHAMQHSQKSFF